MGQYDYTKSSWSLDQNYELDWIIRAEEKSGRTVIAYIPPGTGLENARLMIAAPDLLGALESILQSWRRLGNDTPSMDGFEQTVGERAAAAISKAKGGS